jgi:hypothetical protein
MKDDELFLGQHILGVAPSSLLLSNPSPPEERLVLWEAPVRRSELQEDPVQEGTSANSHSSTASSSGGPRNSFGHRLQDALESSSGLPGDPARIDRLLPVGEPREQNPSGPTARAPTLLETLTRSEQAAADRIRLGSWITSDFYATYAPNSENDSEAVISDWNRSFGTTNVVDLPVEHPRLGLPLPDLSPDRYTRRNQRLNQRRSCSWQEGFLQRGNPSWIPWYPRPDSAEETYPILEDLGLRVGRALKSLSYIVALDQRVGPRLLVRFLLAFWNGFIKGIGHSYPATRLASGARLRRSEDPRGPIVDILEIVEDPPLPPTREGIYLAARNPLAADVYSEYSDPPSTLDDGYAEPAGGTGSAGHSME